MNKQVITFMIAALIFAVLPLTMAAASPADMVGRDIAAKGVEKTLTGTLKSADGEWQLISNSTTFDIHMGKVGYGSNSELKDGNTATIKGFVFENHIAPITVESAGKTIAVWSKDRRPSWAGEGDRRNAVSEHDCDDCDSTDENHGTMMEKRGFRNR